MTTFPARNPLVSIVLPTYNCERYLAASIESCLQQSYQNIELIVVDGGSKDNTLKIVSSFSDPRIKVYHQPANTGRLPGALNIGFSHAAGELFTWTQGDDYFKTDAIEAMVSYLIKNPEVGLVYTGIWFIDEEDRIIGETKLLPPEYLMTTNPVQHCFLYRREVAEQTGEYDFKYLMVEDAEYWMRIYKLFKVATMDGRYYYHRYHSESLTIKNYGGHLALRRLADASKMHFGLSWFRYQQRIANIFIDEAFLAYRKEDYKHVLPCILNGLLRNPQWFGNKGVYSIGLRSILKTIWNN
jgi:glycosyltransferase involved in cell wall biosynthesis